MAGGGNGDERFAQVREDGLNVGVHSCRRTRVAKLLARGGRGELIDLCEWLKAPRRRRPSCTLTGSSGGGTSAGVPLIAHVCQRARDTWRSWSALLPRSSAS